jgi:hypothetical protein
MAGFPGAIGWVDGPANLARFHNAYGVVWDGADGILVGETSASEGRIRKFSIANGTVSSVLGTRYSNGVELGPLPGAVNRPKGLRMIGGDLYFLDNVEHGVLHVH